MAKAKARKHNIIKAVLERKKIKLTNTKHIEEMKKHIDYLHADNDATFISICHKEQNKKWNQWHLKKTELLNKVENLADFQDVYMSLNGMWTTRRTIKDIRHLNAFLVDLDYYDIKKLKIHMSESTARKIAKKTTREMIEFLRKKGLFKKTGQPSFFVDSGNGMYIIWTIEHVPKSCLPVWQLVQNELFKIFEKYGADAKAKDAVHVFRIAGTINSKTNRRGSIIHNDEINQGVLEFKKDIKRYTLPKMTSQLLPELPHTKSEWLEIKKIKKLKKQKMKRLTKKLKKQGKLMHLFTIHSLNWARLRDIETIIQLRKEKGKAMKGCREMILFLYRYFSNCYYQDTARALEAILNLNQQFIDPLDESEVIKATKSAEKAAKLWEEKYAEYMAIEEDDRPSVYNFFKETGAYAYSNKKIIKELKVSQEEMSATDNEGKTLMKTLINKKEKNERQRDYRNEWTKEYQKKKHRDGNGLTARAKTKMDKLNKIQELLENNPKISQKEIAEIVGITKGTVSKYIKELQKVVKCDIFEPKNKKKNMQIEETIFDESFDTTDLGEVAI